MGPKREKTMLLVACAVTVRTAFVACDENHGCLGFYASDATDDVASQEPYDGCIGFYPCDAYSSGCGSPFGDSGAADVAEPADADAGDGDGGDRE